MACITVPLKESFKQRLASFLWVNWSEVGREESLKKEIFEKYVKTGKLSKEDWEFCDKIDWIPGDWLPLKEAFVEKLKKIEKGPHSKVMTPEELDKWFDEL
jgi:hypothetical protein